MNLTHHLGDEEHQGISIKEHNTCVIGTKDLNELLVFKEEQLQSTRILYARKKLRTQYYYVKSSTIGRITLGGQVLS